MKDLKEKIMKHAEFDSLEPHMRRRSVFVVRNQQLEDAGAAIAADESEKVAAWMEDGTLARPTMDEVIHWHESKTKFTVLVVQPFVLIQEEFDA